MALDNLKDNDLIVCCLHREKEDDGPSSIQLEFELSLLASDGSPLIGKKRKRNLQKVGASPLTLVLSLEEGDEGNDICIAAERGFGVKSYYGISGDISLVDDQERVMHSKKALKLFPTRATK
ncbi:hypothetical protein CEXT_526851 [Caerostris extrusa]|uniref:Uncharacterized protein n=1 Tax=Caerostris extrusa TaxID=172846 RepID=A0AAV4TXD7_CAEEX|nr:hypothetical protein CEXT_526851 [Caerostris extrusa]